MNPYHYKLKFNLTPKQNFDQKNFIGSTILRNQQKRRKEKRRKPSKASSFFFFLSSLFVITTHNHLHKKLQKMVVGSKENKGRKKKKEGRGFGKLPSFFVPTFCKILEVSGFVKVIFIHGKVNKTMWFLRISIR